jgi:hypothetical protein
VVLKEGVVELAMYESKHLGNGTPVIHDGERNIMLQ